MIKIIYEEPAYYYPNVDMGQLYDMKTEIILDKDIETMIDDMKVSGYPMVTISIVIYFIICFLMMIKNILPIAEENALYF